MLPLKFVHERPEVLPDLRVLLLKNSRFANVQANIASSSDARPAEVRLYSACLVQKFPKGSPRRKSVLLHLHVVVHLLRTQNKYKKRNQLRHDQLAAYTSLASCLFAQYRVAQTWHTDNYLVYSSAG